MKLLSALTSLLLTTQVLGGDTLSFLRTEDHGRNLASACPTMPNLTPKPDVTYTSGNVASNYNPNTVGEADLTLTFGYNNPSYTLPGDAVLPAAAPRLEAVVYGWDFGTGSCKYDTPLAKTPGAHIAIGSVPGTPPITILTPPVALGPTPVVSLDTPFEDFGPLFYQQAGTQGNLNICVELQVFVCNIKLDFVDVHVNVKFKLDETCDTCRDVVETRANPIDETIGPLDLIDIECGPCGSSVGITITQGTQVDACVNIIGIENFPGACIVSIDQFGFLVGAIGYGIVPAAGAAIPMTGSGATCAGSDGCSVSFLTDASDFQKLTPKTTVGCTVASGTPCCPAGKTCEAQARFTGSVTLGFGDICNPARRHLRELQDSETAVLPFAGEPFNLAVEEAEAGCKEFFLVCLIQSILAWFASLLGF